MRVGVLSASCFFLMTVAFPARGAVEPGSFTLGLESGRYVLEADQAPVNGILARLGELAGVPVVPDPGDRSTVTASLSGVSLEVLVSAVSRSHLVVYSRDAATGRYTVERVVAAASGEISAEEASELTGAEVVRSILDRVRGVENFSQETSTSMSVMGQTMKIGGTMSRRGGKYRMEMTVPPSGMKQIVVSDGETMYTHVPLLNIVQKVDFGKFKEKLAEKFPEMATPELDKVLAGGRQWGGLLGLSDENDLRYVGEEILDGRTVHVVEGRLNAPGTGTSFPAMVPASARHWISTEDGLPRRTVYYGKDGQEMFREEFSNVVVDAPMDEDLFRFTPPEGAQVIDMTDGLVNLFDKTAGEVAPAK